MRYIKSRKTGLRIMLAFLLLFGLSYAFAASCSDLKLETRAVEVRAGSKATFAFYLHNNSNERFYIDRAYAFDFSDGISTQALRWDKVALAGNEAAIVVSIEAFEDAEQKDRNAFLQVRGHFLSGKECHYYELKSDFPVEVISEKINVEELEKKPEYCELFEIVMPNTIRIYNSGTLDFIVKNYSNQEAKIYVDAENASVYTYFYLVPARTIANKTLRIESDASEATIEFTIDLGACGITKQYLYVINEAMQMPSEIQQANEQDVEMSYVLMKDVNGYIISVTLRNLSENVIQGELFVTVPANWQAEGANVVLNPYEEQIIDLHIIPAEESGVFNFDVVFNYDSVSKSKEVTIELAKEKVPAVGFATFAAAGILAGIIVVVIILIIGTAGEKRIREPWQEVAK